MSMQTGVYSQAPAADISFDPNAISRSNRTPKVLPTLVFLLLPIHTLAGSLLSLSSLSPLLLSLPLFGTNVCFPLLFFPPSLLFSHMTLVFILSLHLSSTHLRASSHPPPPFLALEEAPPLTPRSYWTSSPGPPTENKV